MKTAIIIIFSLLFSINSQAFVSLGNDPDCDYQVSNTSIQGLIDQGELNIRLSNQVTFVENLSINKSINISGGYSNCADAEANIVSAKTTLDGNQNGSVIVFSGVEEPPSVITLENLIIENGSSNSTFYPGGGLSLSTFNDNHYYVQLNNSLISNNTGINGGGVYIRGKNMQLAVNNSYIIHNKALGNGGGTANGGGIHCKGGTVSVTNGSGILLNEAYSDIQEAGNGGAIFARDACRVFLRSGSSSSSLNTQGITNNTASAHGGGLYAENNASIYIQDTSKIVPININNNNADSNNDGYGDGGGIYIKDFGSEIVINGAIISNNTAINGGGIAMYNRADISISENISNCWNRSKCNVFENNKASTNNGKGGFLYNNGSVFVGSKMHITKSRADHGTTIYNENIATTVFNRSNIYRNGLLGSEGWSDDYTYRNIGSTLNLYNVTSVHNESVQATIGILDGSAYVVDSIFFEPNTNLLANIINPSPSVTMDCLLVDNDFGVQNLTNSVIGAANFKDKTNNDFHLLANSPGIDMCSSGYYKDIDLQDAGWDDPSQINLLGPFDAGADESYAGDVIFADEFNQ
jgi:hypothetical protein